MSPMTKVGLLAVVALAVLAVFIIRIENFTFQNKPAQVLQVQMTDAQGLQEKSPVLYKGVRVGRVVGMQLDGPGVRATVVLNRPVALTEGARAAVSSVGLLGEKQLEIIPGPLDGRALPPDAALTAKPVPSLDDVISSMGAVGEDVEGVSRRVRGVVEDPATAQKLTAILDNLERITAELSRAVSASQDEIARTVGGIRALAEASARLAHQLSEIASAQKENVQKGAQDLGELTRNLRETSEHLNAITRKVDEGKGTLGQLIDSPALGQQMERTLTSVEGLGGALSDTRLVLGLRGDYLTEAQGGRGVFALEARRPGRRFARLELVGVQVPAAGLPEPRGTLRVSAQVGQGLGPLTLRGGLIESRPGLGLDVQALGERLRVSAEGWDVSRAGLRPNTRVEGAVRVWGGLSLLGGWTDLLNPEASSPFVGAGLSVEPGAAP